MTDDKQTQSRRLGPRRVLVIALLGAAVALTLTLWVGNTGGLQAAQCPAQTDKATAIGDAAVGELAALNGTGTGRGYADMSFIDAAGTPMSIKDFAGKRLLVNFWASWCAPCRAEMPALQQIAATFNSESFMVLPINLDIGEGGLDKAQAFLEEGKWPDLPLYADSTFSAFERLKREAVAVGLPATLLLDEKGCELAVLQGPAEWHTPDGERVIEALIAG